MANLIERGPPRIPAGNPLTFGLFSAEANAKLNQDIREQSKVEAAPVLNAIYADRAQQAIEEEYKEGEIPPPIPAEP